MEMYGGMEVCTPKAISITGRRGPEDCETSRLPHFLDSWLIDGGKVVSLTLRPTFTPQVDSWYSLMLETESTPEPWCVWND
jgi:hypothetical protein